MAKICKRSEKRSLEHEDGFSLLEIMVAMTLFSIVVASVFGLLQIAQKSKNQVSETTGLAKNVRLALNLIGRDTYNAGFGYPLKNTVLMPDNRVSTLLTLPVDADASRDTVPPIIAGNDITLSTWSTVANTKTDQVTFLFKDNTFNIVGTAGPPDTRISMALNINAVTTNGSGPTGIDEIVPISGSNSQCRVNDLYLISGATSSTLGVSTGLSGTDKVQFANADVLGFNLTGSGGPLSGIVLPASMQRVSMVTYFVTPDGTLTRREYVNRPAVTPAVGFVDEPLVYGVENFQVRYIMDDGSVSDSPSILNLAAVRQIRYTVSVRSTELGVDNKPYKNSMTATFSTRNLGYEAN